MDDKDHRFGSFWVWHYELDVDKKKEQDEERNFIPCHAFIISLGPIV